MNSMETGQQERSNRMSPSRLEAFSDGVMAVLITIMVLSLKPPQGTTLHDIKPLIPKLLIYVLSFVVVGIYWNNHHYLIRATKHISSSVMWANLHMLFWLSLVPFITAWVGEYPKDTLPAALYGVIGMAGGISYYILTKTVATTVQNDGNTATKNTNQKGKISVTFYAIAALLAFANLLLSYSIYALVAIWWLIPDKQLIQAEEPSRKN